MTIAAVRGMGGIGKTVLALSFAAALQDRYPDAQLYLDLKGASQQPVSALDAMSHVIRTFRPGEELPESERDLTALYRTVLYGKRVLLLMDNAYGAAQVAPLRPPEGRYLLLTSRQHFELPGAHTLNLGTLRSEDALQLLRAIWPGVGSYAHELAELCGDLPLALRVSASAMKESQDHLSPREYLDRLTRTKSYLDKRPPDYPLSFAASTALSYQLLGRQLKKRWRGLAVFPETTFDRHAAAFVWDIDEDRALDTLGELLRYSMIEWSGETRRYRLHDLLRQVANERLDDDSNE